MKLVLSSVFDVHNDDTKIVFITALSLLDNRPERLTDEKIRQYFQQYSDYLLTSRKADQSILYSRTRMTHGDFRHLFLEVLPAQDLTQLDEIRIASIKKDPKRRNNSIIKFFVHFHRGFINYVFNALVRVTDDGHVVGFIAGSDQYPRLVENIQPKKPKKVFYPRHCDEPARTLSTHNLGHIHRTAESPGPAVREEPMLENAINFNIRGFPDALRSDWKDQARIHRISRNFEQIKENYLLLVSQGATNPHYSYIKKIFGADTPPSREDLDTTFEQIKAAILQGNQQLFS